jgi:hypothetical protein
LSQHAVESRLAVGFQLFGILALAIGIVVLFAVADRLAHNRNQMALTGEATQVLVELGRIVDRSPTGNPVLDDNIARLIGFADVQTSELANAHAGRSVFFSREDADLRAARLTFIQNWNAVKQAFAARSAIPDVGASHDPGKLMQPFLELRNSFDSVFAAISQDTLSPNLLAANSRLLATMRNLEFVLSSQTDMVADAFSRGLLNSLAALQTQIEQLIAETRSDNGGILIGYETNLLLSSFVSQAQDFAAARTAEFSMNESVASVGGSAGRANSVGNPASAPIARALDSASNYQQQLEFASHQNRRAVLFTLVALCLALICLMLALWRIWRKLSTGGDQQGLARLRTELSAIADGRLGVRASQQRDATLNAIAQASNHTADMLGGLVRVFKRTGLHLNELAVTQHQVVRRLATAHTKQQELTEQVSDALLRQSEALEQAIELSQTQPLPPRQADAQSHAMVRDSLQELSARLSVCRNLNGGSADESGAIASGARHSEELLTMRQHMHELTGSISAVRLAAEQARLQVLNTSLHMTAVASTPDINDQSRMVEEMQSASNQLAANAAGAERLSSAIADELQHYAESFANDRYDIVQQFDVLQKSIEDCLDAIDRKVIESDASDSGSRHEIDGHPETHAMAMADALAVIQQQHAALYQSVEQLKADAGPVTEGDTMELLETIGQVQTLSDNLARSAALYADSAVPAAATRHSAGE